MWVNIIIRLRGLDTVRLSISVSSRYWPCHTTLKGQLSWQPNNRWTRKIENRRNRRKWISHGHRPYLYPGLFFTLENPGSIGWQFQLYCYSLLCHSFVRLFVGPVTLSFVCSLVGSFVRPSVLPSVRSFVRTLSSFVCSCTRSFIRSIVGSIDRSFDRFLFFVKCVARPSRR